ncbi:glycosyltransferase [Sulfurisphaera javensis]|uniref:Glycosyltransferase n=1 Tax=Sulfurisphaera javensis TaxID=2049879 RepID=A0AAT9GNE5_9CREN
MILGIADSNALLSKKFGTEKHVHEVIKRLSVHYKIYYFPTTISFTYNEINTEINKYVKIPSSFFSLWDKREKKKFSLTRELFSFSPLAKELLSEYKKEVDSVDFLYIPHNYRLQLMSSILMSELSNGKFGMLLMTDPHNTLLEKESFFKCVSVWEKIWFSKKSAIEFCLAQRLQNYVFLQKTRRLKPSFIGVMNKGVLKYSNLSKYFNVKVISPPHAFNTEALKYRDVGKEDYAVFLGRINNAKGIYEAIEIGKRIKMKIMGYPEDKRAIELARKNGIEVICSPDERTKFETLSRAKVLVSPSHQESFSVTILEALAVRTPVVTYDLPSLASIYEFQAVKFVKEFDVSSLYKKVKEIIEMNNVYNLFDENVEEFVRLHSSWDNVANAIREVIESSNEE